MRYFYSIAFLATLLSGLPAWAQDTLTLPQDQLPVNSPAQEGWQPASDYSNWPDHLPFKILIDQSFRYNDNLLLLPNNATIPPGMLRGDSYSVTTFGAFSRFPVGAQTFFVNGTYGISRYSHDTTLNGTSYSLNGGWDWVLTSRCAGTLAVSDRQAQAPIEELTSFNVNNIHTTAFNESAKCRVTDNVNVVLNSGVSRTDNSLSSLMVNDYGQKFLRGGLEYSIADLDTIGVQATFTKSNYLNRSPTLTPGLATDLDQQAYEFYFKRLLSAKLEVDATLGLTQSTTSSGAQSSTFSTTTYSVKVRWSATPKLIFDALIAQTIAPPQNIVADFEQTQTESLSATYLFSPRLSFVGTIGLSKIKNPTASGVAQSPILVNQRLIFSNIRAIYQVTPLVNATAEYRYIDRKDDTTGLRATSNMFLVGMTYQR